MLRLQISVTAALSSKVVELLELDAAVSSLAVMRGASLRPVGDIILADVARERADHILNELQEVGVADDGTIHIEPADAWLSRHGLNAEQETPGFSSDAIVWADVTQQAYENSEMNWTYIAFMCLATLIASIAIILDSQILVIGAMVLGPEFVPIAALGLALVRRRPTLFRRAFRTLVVGFLISILVATILTLFARLVGWVDISDVSGARPQTEFIYSPDKWSFIVAIAAAAAGVLSLTSARVGGLSGVFISVTTVPASGNVALGLAFGVWSEVLGSGLQLLVNLTGMALAGWTTLAIRQWFWRRRRSSSPGQH